MVATSSGGGSRGTLLGAVLACGFTAMAGLAYGQSTGALTVTAHPVSLRVIMERATSGHPATIGIVRINGVDSSSRWRIQLFKMDSAGSVKCIVSDAAGRLGGVAVTLVDVGQDGRRGYLRRISVGIVRTDRDMGPKVLVVDSSRYHESERRHATGDKVLVNKILNLPGHWGIAVISKPR